MPMESHKQFVMDGDGYKEFVPKDKVAEYKNFFDTYWDYDEKKNGVSDQGSTLGGWQIYKKKLSDQIGKRSTNMVSICIMSLSWSILSTPQSTPNRITYDFLSFCFMQWEHFIKASNPGFDVPKSKCKGVVSQDSKDMVSSWCGNMKKDDKYRRGPDDPYGNPHFVAAVAMTLQNIPMNSIGYATQRPTVTIPQLALLSMKVGHTNLEYV